MIQSYLPLTCNTWENIDLYFHKDVYPVEDQDGVFRTTIKECFNLAGKGCVVVAGLIVAIATPFFLLLDLFYMILNKVKDCYESSFPDELKKNSNPSILEFYRDNKKNDHNVTFEEILKKDYDWLESNHAYIQWLFPLEVKGQNPTASLTNKETERAFKESPELRAKMVEALKLMLGFYGLQLNPDLTISKAANYEVRKEIWLSIGNHNHLRITRIIESLGLHALSQYGSAFFKCLQSIILTEDGKRISQTSYKFWQSKYEQLTQSS